MNEVESLVLDTNVLVGAGFRRGSASAHLVDAVRNGRCQMRWHASTRAEAERILGKIPRLHWPDFEDLYLESGHYEGDLDLAAFAIVPDPADRKFAALAAATDSVLVSSDDDLLSVRDELDVCILTPGQMRRRLLLSGQESL
jgi:predicted nucleic acid-binding protein